MQLKLGHFQGLIESLKQCCKPKILSDRWYKSASMEELVRVREILSDALRDPNEDSNWRVQIRDYILPHINKILRDKYKYYS